MRVIPKDKEGKEKEYPDKFFDKFINGYIESCRKQIRTFRCHCGHSNSHPHPAFLAPTNKSRQQSELLRFKAAAERKATPASKPAANAKPKQAPSAVAAVPSVPPVIPLPALPVGDRADDKQSVAEQSNGVDSKAAVSPAVESVAVVPAPSPASSSAADSADAKLSALVAPDSQPASQPDNSPTSAPVAATAAPPTTEEKAKKKRAPRWKPTKLKTTDMRRIVGRELQGRVTRVDVTSALVDIGWYKMAILHVSELSDSGFISRVADVLKQGDIVK